MFAMILAKIVSIFLKFPANVIFFGLTKENSPHISRIFFILLRIFDAHSIIFTEFLSQPNHVTLKIKFVVSPAFKSVEDHPIIDFMENPSSAGFCDILSSITPTISSFLAQLAFTFSHKSRSMRSRASCI